MEPDGRPDRWLTAAMLVPANPRSAMSAAAASTILRRDSTPSSSLRDSFRAAPRSGMPSPFHAVTQSPQKRKDVVPLDRTAARLVEAAVACETVDGQMGHR